jgi:alpha-mannosidase
MNYYTRLVFPVESLGGYGYGVYTIFADPPEEEVAGAATATEVSGGWVLENDGIKVQIDAASGAVHSLVDKAHGTELADAANPMTEIEFIVEEPRGGSAWELGKLGPASKPEIKEVRGTASGPYIARVEVDWRVSESEFTTTYEVRHEDPTLYMELNGFWVERGDAKKGIPSIKMAFPSTLAETKPCYEIPFGALERTEHNGIEVPALRWAAVTGQVDGGAAGLLLLNDAKHGHSLTDGVLRVTLLRSTYEPDPAPEIGLKTMSLAVRPYAGELDPAEATRKAIAFNNDLRVVGTDDHEGDLPMAMDGLSVSSGTAVVSGFKKADDDDAFVIRLIEYAGRDAEAELTLNETVFGKISRVETVDIMERPGGNGEASSEGNTVNVRVPAYGIISLKVWL